MMHPLNKEQFERARPIFKDIDYNLTVSAVIAGTTSGEIYVDDASAPTAAITWVKHRIYLAGAPGNAGFNAALSKLFAEKIAPPAMEAGRVEFVLYYAPEEWGEHVDEIFKDRFPIKDQRLYFTIKELKHDWRTNLPPDCTLRRVDRALLEQTHLKNLASLIKEIHSERHSLQDFFAHGFGFCLLRDDEIVSWCFSEYNTGQRCEVGIETQPAYHRQGYGTLVASALVEHALTSGITEVGWHCWVDNEASIALAQKVGFEKALEYAVYFAWFDDADNFLVHGGFYLHRLHAYQEAAEWYEKAFRLKAGSARAHYDAARAWALCKAHDPAVKNLKRAVAAGWTDIARLREDADFSSLHGTKGWAELMESLDDGH
jgi:RimJ/RimL family protein N-acetyltransferase